ncbi:MAG TPA: hypothetical protein VEP50_07425 [bacterium]|nr:hypothetical protein [bacterium]
MGRYRSDCCGSCVHFDNDPASLEAAFPGMLSLGSAHISARADDGLCLKHERYLGAGGWCPDFQAKEDGPRRGRNRDSGV